MKNSKNIALMGLALAALVMAGCGPQGAPEASTEASVESSAVESSSTPAEAEKIDVSKVPTNVVEGDVVDFAQYVVVTPEGTPFTLEALTDNAVVQADGHSVKFVNPGNFTVAVKAGSKQRNVKGTVTSAAVKMTRDFLRSIESNYTSAIYEVNNKGELEPISVGMHSDRWCVTVDAETEKVEGVVLMKDEKIYEIESYDFLSDPVLAPGGEDGSYWDYYFANMHPFSYAPIDDIVDGVDEDGVFNDSIILDISGDPIQNLNNYPAIFLPFYCGGSAIYFKQDVRLEFVIDEEEDFDEEGNLISLAAMVDIYDEKEQGYVFTGAVITWSNVGTTEDEILDKFVVEGEPPAAIVPTAFSAAAAALSAAESYTLTFTMESYVDYFTGEIIQEYLNYAATIEWDGKSLYIQDSDGFKGGIIRKDGALYTVASDVIKDESGQPAGYADTYTATLIEDEEFDLNAFAVSIKNEDILAGAYTAEQEITKGEFAGTTAYAAAAYNDDKTDSSVFGILVDLLPTFGPAGAYAAGNLAAGDGKYCPSLAVYANESRLAIQTFVLWGQYSNGYYGMNITADYGKFGTTEVTVIDESKIVFPTEGGEEENSSGEASQEGSSQEEGSQAEGSAE